MSQHPSHKTSLGFTPDDGHLYWRDLFKDFFAAKGCKPIASDRLVPENDPSLLFTGAGMNQFKDDFTGHLKHGTRAATTTQKCMRTPDLENVGKTQRHHTFFEMLGFFSFGDKLKGPDGSVGFFKNEAIAWIWEFYTSKQYCGLDPTRIRVTIYKSPEGVIDQEAYDRWAEIFKAQGLPHVENGWIYGLGENDNFWPAGCPSKGPNGVCGPCSEIFWDLGEQYNKPELNGTDCPENNGARFMELGNIVFTQFERSGPTPGKGVLTPLPQKNIDFGGGFERLVMVKEGVDRTLDSSLFMPVRKKLRELLGKTPTADSETIRERRIADHVRAAAFLIGDGVSPSNEKQGYILRRILRRAYRDGVKLGFTGPFLHKLVPEMTATYGRAYPELQTHAAAIASTIQREEEDFDRILARGLERLDGMITVLTEAGDAILPGAAAFDLHSTFGLPIDVTRDVLQERGLEVDEDGFEEAFKHFRALSRKTARFSAEVFDKGWFSQTKRITKQSGFLGYDTEEAGARVMAIIKDGEMVAEIDAPNSPMAMRGDSAADQPSAAEQAATFTVILDQTPFYGESGGQVGDTGTLRTVGGGTFVVRDTQRKEGYFLHVGHMQTGSLKIGDEVSARVDASRRRAIRANHSATHLLHSALRQVLGDHVHQKGSLVNDQYLRFDFTHPQKVTNEEIAEIERRVNAWIQGNDEVCTTETTPDQARAAGALMFFGEKYGDSVRMLTMGENSKELCGGTHVRRTGDIGYFRVISESSVASGVRRIEAVAGHGAVAQAQSEHSLVSDLSNSLKVAPDQIPARIKALMDEIRDLKHNRAKAPKGPAANPIASETIGGHQVVIQLLNGATMGELLTTKDALMQDERLAAVLLAGDGEGKASMVLALSQPVVGKGLDAGPLLGDIIKLVDGRGGGKKHLAQAGGKAPEKLGEALEFGRKRLEEGLGALMAAK